MPEPRNSGNVRRIDFARSAARHARIRNAHGGGHGDGEDDVTRPPGLERDRFKVVPMPEPRALRRRWLLRQGAMLAMTVLLAAMVGAAVAALVIDLSLQL
jgi:hypothetical protein